MGRFYFSKQLGLAIRTVAAARNPHIWLHICGTGHADEVAAFHTLAEQEGISNRVVFHGELPHDKISTMMECADLLLCNQFDASSVLLWEV